MFNKKNPFQIGGPCVSEKKMFFALYERFFFFSETALLPSGVLSISNKSNVNCASCTERGNFIRPLVNGSLFFLTVGFLKSALEADAASVKMEVASEEQGENITIIASLVPHWPSVWFFMWQSTQNVSLSRVLVG